MIDKVCAPQRVTYIVNTTAKKSDDTSLNNEDYLNIGYMAGRFGINLRNPNEPNLIKKEGDGLKLDINSCTSELFETNLEKAGIKFEKLA